MGSSGRALELGEHLKRGHLWRVLAQPENDVSPCGASVSGVLRVFHRGGDDYEVCISLSCAFSRPGFPRGRRVCFCTPWTGFHGRFVGSRRFCWFRPTLASIAARGGGRRTWCSRWFRRWALERGRSHRSLAGAAVSSKAGSRPQWAGGLHSRATATSQAARRGGVSSRRCFDSSGRRWKVWALLVTR